MYRTCLFCTASLGANDVLEEFPVGGTVAFDAWRGRLWAVCPRCARWNLAPIEERWEAVEAADRLFTDTRVRVQSENVGLAKLRDGTRLIRIGQALPGELAAWRYGSQLVSRRRRYALGVAAAGVAAGTVILGGSILLAGASLSVGSAVFNLGNVALQRRRARRVIHRRESAPGEAPLQLRRWSLAGARLVLDEAGEPMLRLPYGLDLPGRASWLGWIDSAPLELRGPEARTVLSRAMVEANASGASRRHLAHAVELLALAGDSEQFLRRQAAVGMPLGVRSAYAPQRRPRFRTLSAWTSPSRPEALALEMALHEESERRAMEGELSALEAAWREAEEIAAIADALPGDPPEPLRGVT